MSSDRNKETISLINNENGRSSYDSDNNQETTNDNVKIAPLTLINIFLIILGFTMGTGVLVVSYTVHQLGIILWVFLMPLIFIVQAFCAYLLHLCVRKLMEENVDGEKTELRDPYQLIAEKAGGKICRRFSVFMMYMWDISCVITMLLVAASMPATLFPIGSLDHQNSVRIWITIIIGLATPFMYFGTYSDLKGPSYIAVTTSVFSAVIVIINCVVMKYGYINKRTTKNVIFKPSNLSFYSSIEAISSFIFFTGAALTIPGLTVLAKRPKKFGRSLGGAFLVNLVLFLFVALVPYYTYNGDVYSSIIDTFNKTIKEDQNGLMFKTLTMVIQVLMLVHLCSASIFGMNPIFLHSEELMNLPLGCNWKRIASRSAFMLLILCICLIFPNFEDAISIAGGVPFTIMCMLMPVYIYSVMFELNIYKRIIAYFFMILVTLFIVLNLFISIKKIV